MQQPPFSPAAWPPLQTLYHLALALGAGLFVGLEREWRGKEAGIRTFGFSALLCGMAALLGEAYVLVCLAFVGLLVFVLNWQSLREGKGAELTTSAALMVTALCGALAGLGHTVIPTATAVIAAGLLSLKENLAVFSRRMTAVELRAEIQLAILTFAVYPLLPSHAVDPWGFVIPREVWMTVILVAAIGFANYLLWKVYAEHGMEITGFLAGLVNSTIAVAELGGRLREAGEPMEEPAYRGVLLATAAMALRNVVLLAFLDLAACRDALLPIALVLLPCALGFWWSRARRGGGAGGGAILPLATPFSLRSVLKFGLIFLVLQVLAGLAHQELGRAGFYGVSVIGGLISSASAVASAGVLAAHGTVSGWTAATGAVLASLASAAVNIGMIAESRRWRLVRRLTVVISAGVLLALGAAALEAGMAGAL